MKENILRWFGNVEKRNNEDLVKKMREITPEGNWERGRSKKKWMEVIGKYMRAYGVDENMVRYREGCRERIQVAEPTYVKLRQK